MLWEEINTSCVHTPKRKITHTHTIEHNRINSLHTYKDEQLRGYTGARAHTRTRTFTHTRNHNYTRTRTHTRTDTHPIDPIAASTRLLSAVPRRRGVRC